MYFKTIDIATIFSSKSIFPPKVVYYRAGQSDDRFRPVTKFLREFVTESMFELLLQGWTNAL